MLKESEIIDAVCDFLHVRHCVVEKRCGETEQGDDIVGRFHSLGYDVVIEAKGETSSKMHTARYGEPFSLSQVRNHVANAFYRAAQQVGTGRLTGVAFPKNQAHLIHVEKIATALAHLQIEIFWVSSNRDVEVVGHWPTWEHDNQ